MNSRICSTNRYTTSRRSGRASVSGFTLIEIMVTMAIIAILAAIAIPNYSEHVHRTRRGGGKMALLQAAQWLERYRTANDSYSSAVLPDAYLRAPADGSRIDYNIRLIADAANPGLRYTLVAIPNAMSGDMCGGFALDQSGRVAVNSDPTGANGQSSGTLFDTCWPR